MPIWAPIRFSKNLGVVFENFKKTLTGALRLHLTAPIDFSHWVRGMFLVADRVSTQEASMAECFRDPLSLVTKNPQAQKARSP